MIHDYFILLSFLALGFILVSTSSFLKARKGLVSISKENNESLRLRRKSRIWRKVGSVFIFVLLFSRFCLMLIGPSELIVKGFNSPGYITFFLVSIILSVFWIIALYLRYLSRFLNPNVVEIFQNKSAAYQTFLVLFDLLITGIYGLRGYLGLFIPGPSQLSVYQYINPGTFKYMILIILVLFSILLLYYILFIYKRSLSFINQYLAVFLILLATCVIFATTGTSYFVGWYDSIDLNLKILSWKYGYLGWIYILFFGLCLFTVISNIIILANKRYFLDVSRIRLIILPLFKTGFFSLIAFTLLTILPVLSYMI